MKSRTRQAIAVLAIAALTGCERASAPNQVWELAAQGIYAGALSPDATLSLVGSLNHGGSLWRTADHERLFDWNHVAGGFSDFVAVGFSPDGTRAVTTDPRTLVLWNTATGESLGYWATPGAVQAVAVAPDGRSVLMGLKDHSAVLFDAINGAHRRTFLHQGEVVSVDMTHDGRVAITGSADETAQLWNLETGESLHTLNLGNPARIVRVSPAGSRAFTAAQGRNVSVWDVASGALVFDLTDRNPGVMAAAFSTDERQLLVGYVNRTVELWDLESRTRVATWRTEARNAWHETGAAVLAVGFGQDQGTYYALAGDGRMSRLRQS